MKHNFYEKYDAGVPASILDRNGDVVLGLCKACNQGEGDLEDTCPAFGIEPWRRAHERYGEEYAEYKHADDEIAELRAALAASRAAVEGLREACSGSAHTLFLDAYHRACETSKSFDWHDAALLAKQWEQQIDAAMEKGNV